MNVSESRGARSGAMHGGYLARRTVLYIIATLTCFLLSTEAFAVNTPLLKRSHLTGSDWNGVRTALGYRGIRLGATEWAVPSVILAGGARQGLAYSGLLAPYLRVNFGELLGLWGFSATVSVGIVQGRYGPSGSYLFNLNDVTYVEGPPGVFLDDAFIHQYLFGGIVAIQAGQFGVDEYFDQNPAGNVLLNSTFSYRTIGGIDLPGGGPAFPEDSLGVRVRVTPITDFFIQAAVFPGTPGSIDSTFSTGVFVATEADYEYDLGALGLGEVLAGAFYDSQQFPDLSNGQGVSGDAMVYVGANQTVWQGSSQARNLTVFARGAWAAPDRNIVWLEGQVGLSWAGLLATRPKDVLGFGFDYEGISPTQAEVVRTENSAGEPLQPIPDYEMILELAYQIQVAPWFALTPDVQYVVHPGGYVSDPLDPSRTEPNALVALLQAAITL